jgi:hypothetical protein
VGEGRLVTGKFEHSSAEVIDLFVDGVSEPIGTTSNHPFWSQDRQDFVQAGVLRIGERLRLRDGGTPVVTAAVARSQSVPVFNLEVDGEHVYYVATSGVLVHNAESYRSEQEARDAGIPFDANDPGDRASEFGHHQTEDHHPLKQSKTFFEDHIRPNVENADYDRVKGWTVPLDTDVHQGMEKAG